MRRLHSEQIHLRRPVPLYYGRAVQPAKGKSIMTAETHPLLQDMMKRADEVIPDRPALYSAVEFELAKMSPEARMAALAGIDAAIAADEGNLREKSQLLSLRRRMVDTDQTLRRAKR